MMIKRKLDGAVDKSSADQETCSKLDTTAHILGKIWRPTPSGTRFYGRRANSLADEIWAA